MVEHYWLVEWSLWLLSILLLHRSWWICRRIPLPPRLRLDPLIWRLIAWIGHVSTVYSYVASHICRLLILLLMLLLLILVITLDLCLQTLHLFLQTLNTRHELRDQLSLLRILLLTDSWLRRPPLRRLCVDLLKLVLINRLAISDDRILLLLPRRIYVILLIILSLVHDTLRVSLQVRCLGL